MENAEMAESTGIVLMDEIKTYLGQIGIDAIVNFLIGILILFIGNKLAKLVIRLVVKGKGYQHLDKSVQSFIKSFLKIILYAIILSSTAMCWGVPTTTFVTIFTSAGVAIGLALQGALSNFAGGLMILFFKPFSVGDFIECGGVSGTVKDITVIYTILNTGDNKVITIPNGSLTNSNVTNYSALETRRVDLVISAGYEDDTNKVEEILLDLAAKHPLVLKDPAPLARLNAHSASSLDYNFRVWVGKDDYWTVYYDLMEQVKKAFDENGISIPFQQIDVQVKQS